MTPLAAALAAALPRVFENRVVDGRGEDEETVDALADALRYATERGVRPDAQVALAVRLCGRRGDLGAVRAASVVRSLASTSLCHVRLSVSFFFRVHCDRDCAEARSHWSGMSSFSGNSQSEPRE